MSLNPSNGIAARMNPGKTMFQNLARNWNRERVDDPANIPVFTEVDAVTEAELTTAGIKRTGVEFLRKGEVPSKNIGDLCMWGFQRRWYYWAAEGPGIPPAVAEEFHKLWGKQVRVAGHCMCPSPLEWCHGFAVGSYHIDTQEGLNAFANLLRSIYVQ